MNYSGGLRCSRGESFQSLSGLTLGLNRDEPIGGGGQWIVSIPFRADTGFEHEIEGSCKLPKPVSIPFRADTGFEQFGDSGDGDSFEVSIPFRADTGFEQRDLRGVRVPEHVSIPFRADTGFELAISP